MKLKRTDCTQDTTTKATFKRDCSIMNDLLVRKIAKHPTVTMIMNCIDNVNMYPTWELAWMAAHLDISLQYMPHRQYFVRHALTVILDEVDRRVIAE